MKTTTPLVIVSTLAFIQINNVVDVNAAAFAGYELDGTVIDLAKEKIDYNPETSELGSNIDELQAKQAHKDEIALALRSCANSIAESQAQSGTTTTTPGENLSSIGTGENIATLQEEFALENDATAPIMQGLYEEWSANKGNRRRRQLALGDNLAEGASQLGGNQLPQVTDECEVAFSEAEDYTSDTVTNLAQAKSTISEKEFSSPGFVGGNSGSSGTGSSTGGSGTSMAGEEDEDEDVFVEEEQREEDMEDELTCYHFEKDGKGLSLCVEPTSVITVEGTETEYIALAGELENTGMKDLCNVTLSVPMIDDALEASETSIPDNFEPTEKFSYRYVVPIDPESHVIPQVDIWSTFYTCLPPKVVVEEEVVEVEVEEEKEEVEVEEEKELEVVEEEEVEIEQNKSVFVDPAEGLNEFFDKDTDCFRSCVSAIVEEQAVEEGKSVDKCLALNYIFNNKCHTCAKMSIEVAQLQCVEYGCSDEECLVEEKKTSGSSIIQISTLMVGISAAVMMYMA